MSYLEIGRQLGRSNSTINRWLDPSVAEKKHQSNQLWKEHNKARHSASNRRYYSEFLHGKAAHSAARAERRVRERNVPEFVFLDGQWCEVDRELTWKVFNEVLLPVEEREEINALFVEKYRLIKKTGLEHHVDHLHPLSLGGEHRLFNLQILPAKENLSKNNTFRSEDKTLLVNRLFTDEQS